MALSLLQQIQQASLKLLLPLDSTELYRTCVKEAVSLVGANYGSLFLEKNDRLVRVFTTVPISKRLVPRNNGNTYKSFLEGKIQFLYRETIKNTHPEAEKDLAAIILIPLTHQRKRIGIMTLQCLHRTKYSAELKQSLKLFGSLATLAIRNIELYEDAQAALQTRELFMSTAAHELRTPLASIYAYGQLAQKAQTKEQPVQPKWIDAVISGSHKLQILIDDLFSMSQMGMGIFTYTFAQHSVLELLNKVITDNRLLHKRIISFENESAHSLFQIDCDPNKLELVFNNIIGNSIKYSESSTPIHVSLKRKTNVIIISFVDQGRGIPKEDLPHIFEQFYQGKHRANGMGLGMYLCKEIVEAHHGEIRISSTLGKGTKVSMYFPVT